MDIDEEFPSHHEDDAPPEVEQPPPMVEQRMEVDTPHVAPVQATTSGVSPETIVAAQRIARTEAHRARSPTPPRALFRSTTGKGVAFTEEDVTFLVRFLEHRNRQHDGKVDMVLFWKEVAAKVRWTESIQIRAEERDPDVCIQAPHHSRASWMKFYRRHKHELEHTDADAPLPAKPEKKMRYSKADDVLLARYFVTKRDGTLDKVFQEFARMVCLSPSLKRPGLTGFVRTLSIRIIPGKAGRNITEYTRRRLTILSRSYRMGRTSMKRLMKSNAVLTDYAYLRLYFAPHTICLVRFTAGVIAMIQVGL